MYISTLISDYNYVIIKLYIVALHKDRLYVIDVYHRKKELKKMNLKNLSIYMASAVGKLMKTFHDLHVELLGKTSKFITHCCSQNTAAFNFYVLLLLM